jgi:two-component system sensor histidine kinase KdpD
MLSEGHRRSQRGADVVIGFVEAHRRLHTEELIAGLEVVPRRTVEYRGTLFEEMDLEALLRRHPKVALVDELAHTNVPGSSHNPKRWEDVMELLGAGIDIITTVNIQHLESIADAVEQITGVRSKSGFRTGCCARQIRLNSSTHRPNNFVAGCCTGTSIRPRRFPRP